MSGVKNKSTWSETIFELFIRQYRRFILPLNDDRILSNKLYDVMELRKNTFLKEKEVREHEDLLSALPEDKRQNITREQKFNRILNK